MFRSGTAWVEAMSEAGTVGVCVVVGGSNDRSWG